MQCHSSELCLSKFTTCSLKCFEYCGMLTHKANLSLFKVFQVVSLLQLLPVLWFHLENDELKLQCCEVKFVYIHVYIYIQEVTCPLFRDIKLQACESWCPPLWQHRAKQVHYESEQDNSIIVIKPDLECL